MTKADTVQPCGRKKGQTKKERRGEMREVLKTHRKAVHAVTVGLFFCYVILLCYFLFLSEGYGRMNEEQEYRYNLKLFYEIRRFWIYRRTLGWKNVLVNLVGNIAAFVPFGFFLPLLKREWNRFFYVMLASLAFSLVVETLQLLWRVGAFDVDDLLLNTMGGILGLLGFRVFCRIFCRKGREKHETS